MSKRLVTVLLVLALALTVTAPSLVLGQSEPGGRLDAFNFRSYAGAIPSEVDSVAWDRPVAGFYVWAFSITNHYPDSVVGPTISAHSSLDPDLFRDVTSFPITWSSASLGSQESFTTPHLVASNWVFDFTTGFDSSRAMDPPTVPPGGGIQKVTVRVTPKDEARYGSTAPNPHIQVDVEGDVVLGSNRQPDGTKVTVGSNPRGLRWTLHGVEVEVGTTYEFSVKLKAPNESPVEIVHTPMVRVEMNSYREIAQFKEVTGNTASIADTALEGSITYSVSDERRWYLYLLQDNTWVVKYQKKIQTHIIPVLMDIKPGSFPNSINLGSKGTVPVAILSRPRFDATTVDPSTVKLAGAPVSQNGKGGLLTSWEDVDGDGRVDLVVHIETKGIQLSDEDTEAILRGFTFGGQPILASDSVRVVHGGQ